jgi:hypothetical protein
MKFNHLLCLSLFSYSFSNPFSLHYLCSSAICLLSCCLSLPVSSLIDLFHPISLCICLSLLFSHPISVLLSFYTLSVCLFSIRSVSLLSISVYPLSFLLHCIPLSLFPIPISLLPYLSFVSSSLFLSTPDLFHPLYLLSLSPSTTSLCLFISLSLCPSASLPLHLSHSTKEP